MPTYEYQCPAMRKISGGAGLVFKGSGFYITDYGKDGKGPRKDPSEKADSGAAKESKPAAEAKADSSAKSETKSRDKPEAKPDKQAPAKSSKKAAPE